MNLFMSIQISHENSSFNDYFRYFHFVITLFEYRIIRFDLIITLYAVDFVTSFIHTTVIIISIMIIRNNKKIVSLYTKAFSFILANRSPYLFCIT